MVHGRFLLVVCVVRVGVPLVERGRRRLWSIYPAPAPPLSHAPPLSSRGLLSGIALVGGVERRADGADHLA